MPRRFASTLLTATLLTTALLFTASLATASEADADEQAIVQAVRNYADSAYLVKPELIDESVHPKLQKIGYVMRGETTSYRELWMNFYELKDLVSTWNTNGRFDPATAKREIRVLDQLDQTAVARLDAEWGIDYFHLAKLDGTWTIMNVIWQSYPPGTDSEE
ncbi:MAG: nuclear transport factor 2 family protein [Acidobacteriota bacterium]